MAVAKLNAWITLSNSTFQVKNPPETSLIAYVNSPTYEDFFENYLLKNKPCLFGSWATENWKCRKEWVQSDGSVNFEFLSKNFPSLSVPVTNCDSRKYNSQCKENMSLQSYAEYWENYKTQLDLPCLYLKDWHFQRKYRKYKAYDTPVYFSSDWLNEYCVQNSLDDYRFVYVGPKGSWTPLHADVFGSYSWSANLCGKKRWLLFPPGAEKELVDSHNKQAYSVEEVKSLPKHIEVIQKPGEMVFVPSGWYHQVWNLEDCVSVNHNWFNACNIFHIWNRLHTESLNVAKELDDCKGADDWTEQCQNLLKIHHGMNFEDLLELLEYVAEERLTKCDTEIDGCHVMFELYQIVKVLDCYLKVPEMLPLVAKAAEVLKTTITNSEIYCKMELF